MPVTHCRQTPLRTSPGRPAATPTSEVTGVMVTARVADSGLVVMVL